MFLYTIDTGYVCFCLEVVDGIVIHAPGMAKWTLGKSWTEIEEYYLKKNIKITRTRI